MQHLRWIFFVKIEIFGDLKAWGMYFTCGQTVTTKVGFQSTKLRFVLPCLRPRVLVVYLQIHLLRITPPIVGAFSLRLLLKCEQ